MCSFSETSRVRLGNAVMFIASRARYPYKTEILKLLYLMEERMVQLYHIPLLSIPYSVWRLGPVSVDVFEELSDGPVLLSDFVTLQFNGQGIRVIPSKDFDEDEFSDAELQVMREIMEKYGEMNSEQLIELTHKEGSLWQETAKEYGIEIVENKPLARMIYANVEVGAQIPPELYQAVAEILAYVYHLQGTTGQSDRKKRA